MAEEIRANGARALLRQFARRIPAISDPAERLATIPRLVAEHMVAEVCSIYLHRDHDTLELCATEGLRQDAVGRTRIQLNEGLVGRVARLGEPVATGDAPNEPDFRYIPEIGEEPLHSFLGVPIRRRRRILGVLVVQNRAARTYSEEDLDALALVALVLAEMTEAGQLLRPRPVQRPLSASGTPVNGGFAIGILHRHEPRFIVTRPLAENPATERERLDAAMARLREELDDRLADRPGMDTTGVLKAYRRIAHDPGWLRRMARRIDAGLSAEAAVVEVQAENRARIERDGDTYLRERLRDLDDLATRLMQELAGANSKPPVERKLPTNAILVARDLATGDFINYGRDTFRAVALEEGSASSHASIIARSFDLPMVVQASDVLLHGENGDTIIVDGNLGRVFIRPTHEVERSYRDRLAMRQETLAGLRKLRELPATSRNGVEIELMVNAGLPGDIDTVAESGATAVGLYRTEYQFLASSRFPRREELAELYRRVLDAAGDHPVTFRTLDIGSDKPLPGVRREREANPALGLRGIRFGLAHPHLLRMQFQALLRAAAGRPLRVMFPLVASSEEFTRAHTLIEEARATLRGITDTQQLTIGAMLESPSLAYAPDHFFREVDFLSVGGNDLLQFFFAADRGNERVRSRYDPMHGSFLRFLGALVERCERHGVPLSFCGEAAGDPTCALALVALGFRSLSMRPARIGLVKRTLRAANIAQAGTELRDLLDGDRDSETRESFRGFATGQGWPVD